MPQCSLSVWASRHWPANRSFFFSRVTTLLLLSPGMTMNGWDDSQPKWNFTFLTSMNSFTVEVLAAQFPKLANAPPFSAGLYLDDMERTSDHSFRTHHVSFFRFFPTLSVFQSSLQLFYDLGDKNDKNKFHMGYFCSKQRQKLKLTSSPVSAVWVSPPDFLSWQSSCGAAADPPAVDAVAAAAELSGGRADPSPRNSIEQRSVNCMNTRRYCQWLSFDVRACIF